MTKSLDYAIRLLARREHSAYELTDKMKKKGYSQEEIKETLLECERLGLQSDLRFAEMVCRTRENQGYGPLKINYELQAKQIDQELIDATLNQEHEHWVACALQVWHKKYSNLQGVSFDELQKRQRFLYHRGFSTAVIQDLMRHAELAREIKG